MGIACPAFLSLLSLVDCALGRRRLLSLGDHWLLYELSGDRLVGQNGLGFSLYFYLCSWWFLLNHLRPPRLLLYLGLLRRQEGLGFALPILGEAFNPKLICLLGALLGHCCLYFLLNVGDVPADCEVPRVPLPGPALLDLLLLKLRACLQVLALRAGRGTYFSKANILRQTRQRLGLRLVLGWS